MRKPRLAIALLIVTTIVSVVYAYHEPIWLEVAYVRHSDAPWQTGAYEKRADWLPGAEVVIPDQICAMCYFAANPAAWDLAQKARPRLAHYRPNHSACVDRFFRATLAFRDGFTATLKTYRWRCTCQDNRCVERRTR